MTIRDHDSSLAASIEGLGHAVSLLRGAVDSAAEVAGPLPDPSAFEAEEFRLFVRPTAIESAAGALGGAAPSLHEALASLDALDEELGRALDAASTFDGGVSLLEEISGLVASLTSLEAAAHGATEVVRGRHDSVIESLESFGVAVQEDHTGRTSEAIADAANEVSQTLTQSVDATVDELAGDVTSQLVAFATESTEIGTDLDEGWSSLLRAVANEIRDEMAREIKDAVHDAITSGTEALAAELAEAFATMTVGSQITAAMTPVLPYLVAAKKAAQFLNAVKGLFS